MLEKQNSFELMEQQGLHQVITLETSEGLKIVNSQTKEIKKISFQDENILFDWSNYYENMHQNHHSIISATIIFDQNSKLTLKGNYQKLFPVYKYCAGKYVFKKGNTYQVVRNIRGDEHFLVRIVTNQFNGKKYYEKVILNETNHVQEQSAWSKSTIDDTYILPEEIKIILDLNRNQVPCIIKINSVLYDGDKYSYIYKYTKDFKEITEYYNNIQKNRDCLFVQMANQLLKLLVHLEQLEIVLPSIHHKSFSINLKTLDICLMNFNQAYYVNNNQFQRKGATLGYAPPEYFNSAACVTTKANIFQIGAILYFLLFGRTPYGKEQQEIIQNSLKGKLDLSPLQNQGCKISKFLLMLLEPNQQKRLQASQLLKHKIFSAYASQVLSPLSNNSNDEIEEFQNFNRLQNVQSIKTKVATIKKK